MHFYRTLLLSFLVIGLALVTGCKKSEPATGELNLTLTLAGSSSFGNYALYTEGGYLAAATPLREAPVAYASTSGSTSRGVVVVKELAPGNYVVRVYGKNISVQIAAGQTAYLTQAL